MITSGQRSPWPARRTLALVAVFTVAPLLALTGWLHARYVADRFAYHSAVADATILSSDLGCLGAYGSASSTSTGFGDSIAYEIEYPYRGRLHRTTVHRPCAVIPPDFGRGRGAIWIEYDVDHPDRVRVQNDQTAAAQTHWWWQLMITVLAAEGVILLWRWRTRLGRADSGPGPGDS